MTTKRLELLLAVTFLVVGILATVNTIRLNSYIRETVPRDAAQEQCNAATIDVLTAWLQARADRDSAMNARDDAAVTVLDELSAGNQPTSQELSAWRDAVANDRRVRINAAESRHPLPACTLHGKG
jgi:hypothetical protein